MMQGQVIMQHYVKPDMFNRYLNMYPPTFKLNRFCILNPKSTHNTMCPPIPTQKLLEERWDSLFLFFFFFSSFIFLMRVYMYI